MITPNHADIFYDHPEHDTYIFICNNMRNNAKACGSGSISTEDIFNHIRRLINMHRPQLKHAVKLKVNKTGCLGQCAYGPNLVIFPENVWYTYTSLCDIDEVFNLHILQGKEVTRLLNKRC